MGEITDEIRNNAPEGATHRFRTDYYKKEDDVWMFWWGAKKAWQPSIMQEYPPFNPQPLYNDIPHDATHYRPSTEEGLEYYKIVGGKGYIWSKLGWLESMLEYENETDRIKFYKDRIFPIDKLHYSKTIKYNGSDYIMDKEPIIEEVEPLNRVIKVVYYAEKA